MGDIQDANAGWTREIREALREARLTRGLTQADVTKLTGLAQSHLSSLETGAWAPNWETLVRWVAALDAHLHVHVANGVVTAKVVLLDDADENAPAGETWT